MSPQSIEVRCHDLGVDPDFREPGQDSPPIEWLEWYVTVLHEADDPDGAALDLGCGELESLLHAHEDELWPEVERLARADPVFRRALSSVWAYHSPRYEQRSALLEELGEWRSTWIRFVVEPTKIGQDSPLSWRAVELEGSVSKPDLAVLLRSLADWCERSERTGKNAGQAPTGPPPP